ncbi:MAG: SemiSWEET transporter [Syntrophales bacterium]|nr:SemiSWEET transporter [Syntrophales bacterium]
MELATVVGLAAAFLSSLSMAPQVIKIYRTRKTGDLSLPAFCSLAAGLFLWFIYGIMIVAVPVVIGNAVGLSLVLYVVIMKLRYG